MKHSRFLVVIILVMALWPHPASAQAASHIVISELQTGSAASASQEFIELYNPTDQAVALDGWQLQYRPAGATSSWMSKTSDGLPGTIASHGFYLIAPLTYLPNADAAFSSGMAAGGGSVRLLDGDGNVIDLLGWGSGVEFEGAAAASPAPGGSLERLPGLTNAAGGNGLDSDNNNSDFNLRPVAEPQSSVATLETPGEVGSLPTTDPSDPVQSGSDAASDNGSVQINELFIDPVSPQVDAKDEFIELFNPSPAVVNLQGYQLKTGSNFHDSYTLPAVTIAPGGYLSFTSTVTKLALTNTGGAAEIMDNHGNLVDQTAEYDGSLPGLSFSRFGDDWQWTKMVTAGAANVFVAPDGAGSTSASAKAKTTAKKAATTKKAAAKTSKVKAPKAAKKTGATAILADTTRAGLTSRWLIIGLAGLTLGYAIYEFRYDLQNYFVLGRRKLSAWQTSRSSS